MKKLSDYVDCNPTVKFKKGNHYTLVDIDSIEIGRKYSGDKGTVEYTGQGGSKFSDGDTIMARITPCLENGKLAQYRGATDAIGSTELFVFRAKKGISSADFVYYFMKQAHIRNYAANSMTGASGRQRADIGFMKKLKCNFPQIEKQERIASILSAYDDLIENNNKRIMIMEMMAENLYKEWFVRFRFPGYEQAEFENGIPKGWETKRLGDELEVKRGGSPRPIHEYISDTGLKWLKISDATQSDNPYIVNIEESIIEEGLKKTVYLKAGSLVLSNSATPGLPRILTIDSCIHDGWLYFPKKKLSNEYLYLLFNHIRPHLLSKGNGAIFTNLKTDILKKYLFTKPTDIILSLFNDLVKPIFGQIYSLTMKNQNLTKQRDMLLPRLMSGKLEV